jgi:hypothetical protein
MENTIQSRGASKSIFDNSKRSALALLASISNGTGAIESSSLNLLQLLLDSWLALLEPLDIFFQRL